MTDPLEAAARATRPTDLELPTASAARERLGQLHARRRRARGVAVLTGAAGALAAGALIVLALPAPDDGTRARGVEAPPDLAVQAAVVAPTGQTRPADGRASLDEQLVFRVQAGAPGTLTISELRGGTTVPVLSKTVQAGAFTPGGAQPLGWTPDGEAGTYAYVVELCPKDAPCATRTLEVTWE